MINFSKSEFLNFLYEEKNREIQESTLPGWNIWVIFGAIGSIGIYMLNLVHNTKIIFSYVDFFSQLLPLFAGILSISTILLKAPAKIVKLDRFRYLKNEAPWVSYLAQYLISIFCAGVHYLLFSIDIAFILWMIVVFLSSFLLFYIYCYRNQVVWALSRWQILPNNDWDFALKMAIIVCYTIIPFVYHSYRSNDFFYFQLAVGIAICTFLLLTLIRLFFMDRKIANQIDTIIDEFIVSNYTQEEAYNRYLLAKYGFDVYQLVEEEQTILRTFVKGAKERRKDLEDTIEKAKNNHLTFEQTSLHLKNLEKQLDEYAHIDKVKSRLVTKLEQIIELKNAALVNDILIKIINELPQITPLVNELIELSNESYQAIASQKIFDSQYQCQVYGTFCEKIDCPSRNEKPSVMFRIKRFLLHLKLRLLRKL